MMKKAVVLLFMTVMAVAVCAQDYIPEAPDYGNELMWYTSCTDAVALPNTVVVLAYTAEEPDEVLPPANTALKIMIPVGSKLFHWVSFLLPKVLRSSVVT